MPDLDIQPLVIGPDGRISHTTPRTTRTSTPPQYFKGSGDFVSEFLARMTNDMINNLFWTPETIVERNPNLGGQLGPDAFETLAKDFESSAKKAADGAARDARNGAPPDRDRPHQNGACWCGVTHRGHLNGGELCWCGERGLHAAGTPR